MIFLEKRAHLVPEIPLGMVRLLPVDVSHESPNIRRTDREQSITTLPREIPNSLLFHPHRRSRLDLRHDLRRRFCRSQSHRKMNVITDSTNSKAFAIQFACRSRKIRMKSGTDFVVDQRGTLFRAENDMHQVETQGLRHRANYMSGLQPSPVSANTYLGLRPRLVCRQAFGLQLHRILAMQPNRHILSTRQAPTARQHNSLGRRPRWGIVQSAGGLKARHIVFAKYANAVYADFNNCDQLGTVRLNTVGSLSDLAATGVRLEGGTALHLTNNELKVNGIAEFSKEESIWTARFNWHELGQIAP